MPKRLPLSRVESGPSAYQLHRILHRLSRKVLYFPRNRPLFRVLVGELSTPHGLGIMCRSRGGSFSWLCTRCLSLLDGIPPVLARVNFTATFFWGVRLAVGCVELGKGIVTYCGMTRPRFATS